MLKDVTIFLMVFMMLSFALYVAYNSYKSIKRVEQKVKVIRDNNDRRK